MLRASLLVALILASPAVAHADPDVSLGAGASAFFGAGRLGYTVDGVAAWWLRPTWAVAMRGGLGKAILLDPATGQHDPFAADIGAGPMYRRCGRSTCHLLSSLLGFQRLRATYGDGLVQDDPWTERRDSLFVEARATGQVLIGAGGHVSLDASLGLRGHQLVAYDTTILEDYGAGPGRTRWLGVVASLGLGAHF